MKLKDIRKSVRNMHINENIDDYDNHLLIEIKKVISKGFKIDITKQEIEELIQMNYRLNKRFLDDYLIQLIKDNNIDLEDYLLRK